MMTQFSLGGRVARADTLAPLGGVSVRLIGPASALAGVAGTQPIGSQGQICWTGMLSNFAGNRWECWTRQVQPQVRGMSWPQFRDGAVTHNPTLASDGLFKADQTYLIPQVVPVAPYAWTRQLINWGGTRWECWTQQVNGRVAGLTWEQFRDDVLLRNPQLNTDGRVFKPFKSYVLPEPNTAPRAALETTTDAQGNYRFDLGTVAATFELQVEVDDYARWVQPFMINDALTQPVLLQPQPTTATTSGTVRSALATYSSLAEKQRRVIDWALFLLGDDQQTFDALPPELRPLCYGAQFVGQPNHPHYKDLVCADVVSIAFKAAGCDITWRSAANPHMADYYHPDRGNSKLIEITAPDDWQPGDLLVYGSQAPNGKAQHVNMYVGLWSGTDRSGRTYTLSEGLDVIEGSLDASAAGRATGTGVIGCTLQRCLHNKRGARWVRHVRLRELA